MGSWNDLGFDGEDQALYDRLRKSCIVCSIPQSSPPQLRMEGPSMNIFIAGGTGAIGRVLVPLS
jgi:hypothetical protein